MAKYRRSKTNNTFFMDIPKNKNKKWHKTSDDDISISSLIDNPKKNIDKDFDISTFI